MLFRSLFRSVVAHDDIDDPPRARVTHDPAHFEDITPLQTIFPIFQRRCPHRLPSVRCSIVQSILVNDTRQSPSGKPPCATSQKSKPPALQGPQSIILLQTPYKLLRNSYALQAAVCPKGQNIAYTEDPSCGEQIVQLHAYREIFHLL